jgi:hypothetical protein
MAVVIQLNELLATWNGRQWAGKDEALIGLLNSVRGESVGYLPDEVNARAMAQRALGDAGWRVIRSDPQPVEPGVVY